RRIYATPLFWTNSQPILLPAPVNDGDRDYSPAVAWGSNAQRLWWTSSRLVGGTTTAGLFTWGQGDTSATHVPIVLEGGCHAGDEDLHPWVSPDGTLLLFSATFAEPPYCDAGNNHRRLWFTHLDDQGQQVGTAVELASLRQHLESSFQSTEFDMETPSLGPAFCSIYFSSNVDQSSVVDFDVYTASRR